MEFTRRQAMGLAAGGVLAGLASQWTLPGAFGQAAPAYEIAPGPFKPTWASLEENYRLPDWYRDFKFGIWTHWGPQCQPGQGDWYAQRMYMQGQAQNAYHVKTYGPPSKFGFKDVINEWKADKWDPQDLIGALSAPGRSSSCRWPTITTTSTCGIRRSSPGTRSRSGRKRTSSACGPSAPARRACCSA